MGNDKRERKAKRTRKNKTVIQSITIQIQFKSFITISIPPFPSFLKTRFLFIIISPFSLLQSIINSKFISLNITTLTLTHRILGISVTLWVGLGFNNHHTPITHSISSTITSSGGSHHSYTCGHGDTPVHSNLLETLTQWLEQPFHQTLQTTQRWVEWETLNSLFISFPFLHQFFISSCIINQMKWK